MRNFFGKLLLHSKTLLFTYLIALSLFSHNACQSDPYPLPVFISTSYDYKLTEWLMEYLQTLDDDTPLQEVIDMILEYRECLMLQGYIMPSISDMMPYFQSNLKLQGIELPDQQYEFLRQEFLKAEKRLSSEKEGVGVIPSKHHKHKHQKKKKEKEKWEFSFTRKSIFGILKFCGGAITFLVPHPAAQGIGVALMSDGIKDIFDDCRDKDPSTEEDKKRIDKAIECVGCP